ncbi:MAG TPA: ATP-binding protein [Pyrinomonadaceae bacterium]|nr:ATP-binding protein [Pyrinomonadaceae bacterium]
MAQNNFISEALCNPTDYIAYSVSEKLGEMFEGSAIVEGDSDLFELEQYARAGHCSIVGERGTHGQFATNWRGAGRPLEHEAQNAWFNVLWQGQLFEVVFVTWTESGYRSRSHWIVADTREAAEKFYRAVCEWGADVRGEILVFDGGYWEKSEELFKSIKAASFDDLILPRALGEEVRHDLPRFFAARETYERYGVPWKRGVLLIGPPGNGKTHAVKAMVNLLGVACLYVKSLEACDGEHASFRKVFQRARHNQPCLVVLEDIDSLVTDKNRSVFLNELDGFASNTGVVVIATTNHPEKLDPSILDRPSRFDRKFYFELPATEERERYARRWNDALQAEMRIDAQDLADVVNLTDGFSFAYMKELFVSAMMEWINAPERRAMGVVMAERVARLRQQMGHAKGAKKGEDGKEEKSEDD